VDITGLGGFVDDKSAMENQGYWATAMYRGDAKTKNRLDTDFAIISSPYVEGGKPSAGCTSATGGVINSRTKNINEVWKVFEWYFGGKPAQERAKSGWGLPIFKSLMSSIPQNSAFDKQAYDMIQKELGRMVTLRMNPFVPSNFQGVIDKNLQPVLFDKMSLDEGLKKLQEETDKIIQEGMQIAGVK
jgi:multiple sugar transport system substrate-binding protein